MIARRTFLTAAAAAAASSALPLPALAYTPPKNLQPTNVRIAARYQPGEIVILPRAYYLYYVTAPNEAIRYGIAVAKPGLGYTGTATIKRKVEWPTWRPTAEMIKRDPAAYGKFEGNQDRMAGGPGNPLGARAMYLYEGNRDTYIRIHGTVAPKSIGRMASSGCFRMINDHVIDLYNRVDLGTKVTVLQ
ncbi:L,D-transpeptidase [Pseudooceanicola nitratireducens]|jgi:lipoprotein-anchoring transpeptidase ErfK/SrfK|uniref:Lipoprotein-anchoring transpeptidase ErfK/SrfK n=1 Tax=Pseudooceanicola nitratireducens TaxID=517719 RepID=A0A1I1NMY2_9RHOB|nr:L,D-transpeptidase [Pseudooceanicola nitratireducens]MEC7298397.1 L,D-transpeptidase [Pseudomonadota bacterium]MBY6156204.1 L,D-transpeptidase [Pseudooceanicola nitratireducens]MBY6167003.1 L,D-transpeptidase [Pseudooceanicola nitratireducens]MEC7668377.1 L,D-transpeptidase [Pseudomonadota bacterium]MEC7792016.1 L,D-transpeptidase [Pseudomonadota bacterium]|eukprot:g15858.t1